MIRMIRHRWQQLKALSLQDWIGLFVCYFLLVLVAGSLSVSGYHRTRNLVDWFATKGSTSQRPGGASMAWAHAITRLVNMAAWHGPVRFNCLSKALVLWGILTRRGIPAEIRFGLHHEPDETMFAHAWVECHGVNLVDSAETRQRITAFV